MSETINLTKMKKGQTINLTKRCGNKLTHIMVGLGWDPAKRKSFFAPSPEKIDCDASVILCGSDGKTISRIQDKTCVYYGNKFYGNGVIVHGGDNLTGEGDGDDETISVDLSRIPENVYHLIFVVNIFRARSRRQHFGMVENAYIHLVNTDTNKDICQYNLTENYDGMTGLIVGEVRRINGGDWEFVAIGEPVKEASDVSDLVRRYY